MTVVHTTVGYLSDTYLSGPYLGEAQAGNLGIQFHGAVVDSEKPFGIEFQVQFPDIEKALGIEFGAQFQDEEDPFGVEFEAIGQGVFGIEFQARLYNTTNLRILCEFPSRGTSGTNWSSNSVETGDYSPDNLNTDIVEEITRTVTGVITGVNWDCDAEIAQGIFLDTFALLNHNLTTSATVFLIGSDNASHSPTGVVIPLEVTEENIYYIADDIPLTGYRYWRISINDSTNPDNFLSAGTCVFGSAEIFQGECFVDQVGFQFRDFTDKVPTEGFTNVSNSRALKRAVQLQFRSLDIDDLPNFNTLRSLFTTYRTTHKCLWIPTPDVDDQEITGRFAVFAKLEEIPGETHNYKTKDYATFAVQLDESL